MHAYDHSVSHAQKFGGKPEDYQAINNFLDSSKIAYCHWQHRALLHNSFGCFLAEQMFGLVITNSDGKQVPVRTIAEAHIAEDLGHVPSVQDWLANLNVKERSWMHGGYENSQRTNERKAQRRDFLKTKLSANALPTGSEATEALSEESGDATPDQS